jgi:hypothetical protein
METVKRQTESYLFENSDVIFRAIPFYELSIEEWVVYQKGQPKYLIDFNRRNKPLIRDLRKKLESGEELDKVVSHLGRFLGRQWTIHHNIKGKEIPNSWQQETVELTLLDDLSDLFIDLVFIATDLIDTEVLLNEDELLEEYLVEDENGYIGLESAYIDNESNLEKMLNFLFGTKVELKRLASSNGREVFDLTEFKQTCITTDELEGNYQEWIENSGRDNTMDEYGNLICIIGYVTRCINKKNLVLITEKRKHFDW